MFKKKLVNGLASLVACVVVATGASFFAKADRIDSILTKEVTECFYQYNWENFDRSQKMIAVSALVNELTIELGVNKPAIVYYIDPTISTQARYNTKENMLMVNEEIMYSSIETMKAVSHEMRHAWQYQSGQYAEQFANYVNSETNREVYSKQGIEVDADYYAEMIFFDLLRTAGRI